MTSFPDLVRYTLMCLFDSNAVLLGARNARLGAPRKSKRENRGHCSSRQEGAHSKVEHFFF